MDLCCSRLWVSVCFLFDSFSFSVVRVVIVFCDVVLLWFCSRVSRMKCVLLGR